MGKFLTNYTEESFLNRIKGNLKKCTSFSFSVSFIKKAGLVLLFSDIEAALERGATGRLITSTYQYFTDVESLQMFSRLMKKYPKQFDCHLDYESFRDERDNPKGFHSKGYLFGFEDGQCEFVVGSSNITRYALLKNIEWDVVVDGKQETEVYRDVNSEYANLWVQTQPLTTDLIAQYRDRLSFAIERWDMDFDLDTHVIKPNYMQRRALKELNRYRAMGIGKALIVASTGSGKTYLAAFDALNFAPNRLLYIVHEESILRKSLETFKNVFGESSEFGVFTGKSKDFEAKYLFATNASVANALNMFDPNEFDYLIVDECHHAVASTYKKIIEYFHPEFLLGLTATPERMDGGDVFDVFDYNIPFELRLREAIVNDLVVPFKYYGIRDTLVDYGLSQSEERKLVSQIASAEHIGHIVENIEEHRPEGKLKALAFCKNRQHARMMAEALGEQYKTLCLTGSNTVGERISAYNDLQSDREGSLEILCTVDILNEGVDIPGVNMVLFLRPTDSSTIFIQQLGRGLRKCGDKKYVTILDFIGNNYKRSVQIALAMSSLAQNAVLEKRLMKDLVRDDFRALDLSRYGVEIHMDAESKDEILDYIDRENFNRVNYLREDYKHFKEFIHSSGYPKHMDYLNNEYAPDLMRFLQTKIDGKKNKSYYNFLHGICDSGSSLTLDSEQVPTFSKEQVCFIDYLSELLPLVRPEEYALYSILIDGHEYTRAELRTLLQVDYPQITEESLDHAIRFMVESEFVVEKNDTVLLAVSGIGGEYKSYIEDLLEYGLTRYEAEYKTDETFKLWASYRMGQVQQLLLKNPGSNQKGTYVYGKNVYIFASIKKDLAEEQEHLNYKDKFIDAKTFQWECEAGLNQANQQKLIESDQAFLFIRKVESENGVVLPFTYIGKGKLTNPRKTENVKGSLLFDILMDEELPEYLQYDFNLGKE